MIWIFLLIVCLIVLIIFTRPYFQEIKYPLGEGVKISINGLNLYGNIVGRVANNNKYIIETHSKDLYEVSSYYIEKQTK